MSESYQLENSYFKNSDIIEKCLIHKNYNNISRTIFTANQLILLPRSAANYKHLVNNSQFA